MKIPKEEVEQKAFINYCKLEKLVFFSPMNETPYKKYINQKTFMILESQAKLMGKTIGVNDVFVFLPKVLMCFEFKRRQGGKQSDDQVKWENKMKQFSYCKYFLVRSYEEAIELCKKYS